MNEENIKKVDFKKYLPIIVGAIALIILAILATNILGRGPEEAVESYINGINSKNIDKVIKSIDFIGQEALDNLYIYDEEDFSKDKYNEFKKYYKETEEEYIAFDKKYMKENLKEDFDEMKNEYKSYKVKVEKIKSVKKIEKDLYAVNAIITQTAEPKDENKYKIDDTDVETFFVYKDKIIYTTFSASV